MSVTFNEYPDREMLYLAVANLITGQLAQQLRMADRAALCVPGGTTPAPVLGLLSGTELDWDRVTVFLNDERWVGADNIRSNTRLLREHLLRDHAAQATYIDLFDGAATPADAAPHLADQIEAQLPITVTLVGMGDDMHTASLFPGLASAALGLAADAPAVIPVEDTEEPRISLSARALKSAINVHLLITGAAKREAFEKAQNLDPIDAPIRALCGDLVVHWAE